MRDSFSTYHPIINFIYFISVILFSMFFMHPVFLGISLICSIIYSIYLKGMRALKFNLLYMIPTLLFVAIMNPLFNHQGATILLYVNDNPLTLEAIVFGVAAGVMLISVIMWFSCYNEIMSSDKFLYLFGRVIPSSALIISMVLRFVPKFKAQIKEISNGQKAIGRDFTNGNLFEKVSNGIKIISILVTWALENAIETADSMKARGHGLKGRTSFSLYRFDKRDKGALLSLLILISLILIGTGMGVNSIYYYPAIVTKEISPFSIMVFVAYGLLCIFPVIVNVMEDLKWK